MTRQPHPLLPDLLLHHLGSRASMVSAPGLLMGWSPIPAADGGLGLAEIGGAQRASAWECNGPRGAKAYTAGGVQEWNSCIREVRLEKNSSKSVIQWHSFSLLSVWIIDNVTISYFLEAQG